jgi:hypothetical protein
MALEVRGVREKPLLSWASRRAPFFAQVSVVIEPKQAMPWAAIDSPGGVLLDGERVPTPRAIQREWFLVHRREGRGDHTQVAVFLCSRAKPPEG